MPPRPGQVLGLVWGGEQHEKMLLMLLSAAEQPVTRHGVRSVSANPALDAAVRR